MKLLTAQEAAEPCSCNLCLALLRLFASAERNLQREMEERNLRVIEDEKGQKAA